MPRARSVTPSLAVAGQAPLSSLPGVGPKVAEKFAARGILSLQDLWLHLPLRYEDRTRLTTIAQLQGGVPAQIEGRVEAMERGFRFRPVLRVAMSDDSCGTLVLRFFHFRAAQVAQFSPGTRLRVFGTPKPGQNGWEIVHPSYRVLAPDEDAGLGDCLDPVYPVLEGVGPATLRKLIGQALERLPPEAALELLPPHWLQDEQLPSLRSALLTMHRPPVDTDPQQLLAGGHPAQQRLAIEELLAHQVSLRRQRIALQRFRAPQLRGGRLVQQLRKALPFQLTGAQQRVFEQIAHDLAQPAPMLRLVQGDVGSGKTVVAALAAMLAVEHGKQVALAAPTELLAEQHLANLRGWLEPLGVRIVWLAGKVTGKARAAAMAEVASGQAQVVVGTHALMQDAVVFHDLALAIIDEQHRFGVHQRLALRDKGAAAGSVPHQLVMTATPIPRTLAMAAYADLDVSAIDELPPGRTPVQTIVLSAERRPELVERIRAACAEGRQAYWVCTLIEESEDTDKGAQNGPPRIEAQAAQVTFETLSAQLPGVRVALVHGRMKPAEKQQAMLDFKQGRTDLLVATTVIEVGVDVPNASLMIIENAERLGLAQLHQLRGRVGRGAAASSCVLLYQGPLSLMARQRLETMRQTNDGFVIAEKDLELRGPGELLGTRQTGLASFRIADLARDAGLLPRVQVLAERLLDEAPEIADRVVARWIGGAVRYAAA
ncbi:ATP-dependent DNA helicase RecG [Xanthomonas campestris]|uniref:ATP-dependent DNA helicase RecG n=1 Tax=Xanthomonas campestris TaxID=339 RepID=UPI00096F3B5F|nr:ATP-dependent DNA helicase RecG [Xanthomonas campestris]MEA9479391.1 ATP-dependent DNA helicase RecG [Xanthomonas campestris]WDJ01123.1 ATP-dependent DNA helicase RecG [Xanthomonas campestris]WDJ84344.1 ATP-dependent DNA helicase RecG [Xanthomonas campestris pv. incanae]WDJ89106.1 ATP-dependent DNA helicase RecG [Xanthomonas campestris]WDK26573.1 ATP-dependent DNA helicase RecG [Xanthomonas campestris pv. incanae]